MKSLAGKRRLVWGGLVLLLALMSLLQMFIEIRAWVWAVVLAAGLIALTELNVLRDETIGGYTLLAVAIPFFVVNALNPRQRGYSSSG